MVVVAEKIKARRKELGLTQLELADRMGCDKSTISRTEKGEFDLPLSRVAEFARALHTTPGHLQGWDVSPEEAGATAAKVLKNPETFQFIQDYLSLDEAGRYALRLTARSMAATQKKD